MFQVNGVHPVGIFFVFLVCLSRNWKTPGEIAQRTTGVYVLSSLFFVLVMTFSTLQVEDYFLGNIILHSQKGEFCVIINIYPLLFLTRV